MRDRIDRAGLLAGVAADADLRIDEMLLVRGWWLLRPWSVSRRSRCPLPVHAESVGERSDARAGWGDFACAGTHRSAALRRPTLPRMRGRDKTIYAAIFTYSKSPGLLSMPTFGGEIQPANLPGSITGFISASMKSPSAFDGSH